MPALTLFYILPAGVFTAVALLWYVRGKLPRLFAVLPVLACYAATACLLLVGGMCHRVAHVRLSGLEMDLVDRSGELRAISLGGATGGERAGADIEIPGLPPEALRIGLVGDQLKIGPGPGYQRGILVRSGGELVALEPGGVPCLVPLAGGDEIIVPANEGGEVVAQWRLGNTRTELEVNAARRWIGNSGAGAARLPGMPAQMLSLRIDGRVLVLARGAGWSQEYGVLINGRAMDFGQAAELRVAYFPGLTTLAIAKPEPLAGRINFEESAPPLRLSAFLNWQSASEQPPALPFEMETGRAYRAGGSLEDDIFVKGLPAGALSLSVTAQGLLMAELTKDGLKAQAVGRIAGTYPQTAEKGVAISVGNAGVAYAGSLQVLEAMHAEGASAMAETQPSEGEIDPATTAAQPTIRWRCVWRPAVRTRWQLPNRTIDLPLVDVPVDLFARRSWAQKVFPLNQLTAREGSLRSLVAYAPGHPAWINGASLLQFEPGLKILRTGGPVKRPENAVGVLRKNATLEFLQVLADTQGGNLATSLGEPLHPATVTEQSRVTVRRRFAAVRLEMDQRGRNQAPVLRIEFERPQIRSVPISEVKAQLAALDDEAMTGVRFGLNDHTGFSDLPHQVTFPLLTRSFDDANADVEMHWGSFTAQDDFKRQTLDYGEPFKTGGANRLLLSITKETVPLSRVFWVIAAGIAAVIVAWVNGVSFWWVALQFGVAFLTCNRVLFGQAVMVNPPFNPEVVATAMKALVLAPLLLGLGMFFLKGLLPGRIEQKLRAIESRLSYRWLAALAFGLLFVRLFLLGGLGYKEALAIGGLRVALSCFFVPAYLILFAQACHLMWLEKEPAGGLLPRVVTRFALISLWLFACQATSALLVSDLGMFLYFVPMALVLAVVGVCALWDGIVRTLRITGDQLKAAKPWLASLAGLGLVLPLLAMVLVFTMPKSLINAWPGLMDELSSSEDLVTDSTLLRVLQFADEDYLINLGTDTAERIAQDHAIMANYAHRGLFGEGYLQVDVLPAKAVTALNDNVSAVFIFAQFGVVGALAVVMAYLAIMLSSLGARETNSSLTTWLALMAGLSFALVSLYMMAANYGLLPFTGRNMYLLGLNSWSDVAESFALIVCIMLGLARADFGAKPLRPPSSRALADIIEGNAP